MNSIHSEINSTDHSSANPPPPPPTPPKLSQLYWLGEMYNVSLSVSHYLVIPWAPGQFTLDDFYDNTREIPSIKVHGISEIAIISRSLGEYYVKFIKNLKDFCFYNDSDLINHDHVLQDHTV